MPKQQTDWIGFTGSRSKPSHPLPPHTDSLVEWVLTPLSREHTLVVGGCIDMDAKIARIGTRLGFPIHAVIPAKHDPKRDPIDEAWKQYSSSFEIMPPGTTYIDRDRRMVERSTRWVIGFPVAARAILKHSGTWTTLDIARKMGRDTFIYILEETASPSAWPSAPF